MPAGTGIGQGLGFTEVSQEPPVAMGLGLVLGWATSGIHNGWALNLLNLEEIIK